ncbi:hypothetical protein AVEN_255200-1 [Araneus ventricosus]|uniref:Uncharacterized protein n=1 Tax=Araneus ventricosus TaxID=182803 RepID=A0A4Y2BC59_ARAVE|nr:hypothetical protein AVEN_255200-1 [Araneus ventricosus]
MARDDYLRRVPDAFFWPEGSYGFSQEIGYSYQIYERLVGSLETDSEILNEKGFSESETIVGFADDLFIVAERINRAVGSGVTVGHIDELEKGLSGNDVVLKGGVNAGKLVEDSVSGGLGLPSDVVAGLNYDGLDLTKPRSKSCNKGKLLVSGGPGFCESRCCEGVWVKFESCSRGVVLGVEEWLARVVEVSRGGRRL